MKRRRRCTDRPRKLLLAQDIATHGSVSGAVLDFTINVNPFPLPPEVREALRRIDIFRYPEARAEKLRAALSAFTAVPESSLLVTNGSSEAILLAAFTYLEARDIVLVLSPTYSEYLRTSVLCGARPEEIFTQPPARPDMNLVEEKLRKLKPKMLWMCNPNSPTGTLVDLETLAALQSMCIETGTLLVVDESYAHFSPERARSETLVAQGNLLLIRSMTKDFAVNTLRLGYVLAHPEIVALLNLLQPPWSVNGAASAAGIAALGCIDYYRDSWHKTQVLAETLSQELRTVCDTVYPSQANFILCKIAESSRMVASLQEQGVYIRDCSSFRLPSHVRIGVRKAEDNNMLLAAMRSISNTTEKVHSIA